MRQNANPNYRITLIVRGLVLAVFLLVIWSLSKNLFELTQLDERLIVAQEEVNILNQRNEELQAQAQKLEASEFVEGAIRNKLGLVLPGETVVILPNESLKQTFEATQTSKINNALMSERPIWLRWLQLFL